MKNNGVPVYSRKDLFSTYDFFPLLLIGQTFLYVFLVKQCDLGSHKIDRLPKENTFVLFNIGLSASFISPIPVCFRLGHSAKSQEGGHLFWEFSKIPWRSVCPAVTLCCQSILIQTKQVCTVTWLPMSQSSSTFSMHIQDILLKAQSVHATHLPQNSWCLLNGSRNQMVY